MDSGRIKYRISATECRIPTCFIFRCPERFVHYLILVFTCILSTNSFAQSGGNHTFDFLNLNASTPITALGGVQIATGVDSGAVGDVHAFLSNPSLNNEALDRQTSLSYQPYFADIDFATVSYSHFVDHVGQLGASVSYLSYGEFAGFDAAGLPTGDFSASAYTVTLNYAHQMAPFQIGGNLKLATSFIAGLRATGLLLDLGGVYRHPSRDLTIALTVNNVGVLLSDYAVGGGSRLPADARVGVAFKPRYMPFRFHLTAYRLWKDFAVFASDEPVGIVDKIARHLSFGGTLLLSRSFQVNLGYNHLTRSTLQLQQISGGAGLSFGFMFRTSTIRVDFSRSVYHVSGAFNQFSLSIDLDQLFFK